NPDSDHAIWRLDGPGVLTGGGCTRHRRDLPRQPHVHHQPRRVQQGAWLWRPVGQLLAAAAGGAGDRRHRDRAAPQAGGLSMWQRLSNIYHLGVKELWSLWRDPIMLVLTVFSFTFAVYSAASSMPETLNNAPIAIVDEDQSQLSQR